MEALDGFHPAVRTWFEARFGSPTGPQRLGWPAIRSGAHTLIAAPTGSGKTLSAFLAALDSLFRQGLDGGLADATQVVYVSPLKALSNDIHKNLEEPLAEISGTLEKMGFPKVEVRAAVRTGDTASSRRQAMARKPPHILVTTPESLYLLLTSVSGRRMLQAARTLIIDEIHALAPNRRGAHLALSIERLEALAGAPLQRIGLSATQRPIEEAARFLVGARSLDAAGRPLCRIIDEGHRRAMDLAIETPGSPLEAVMSLETWGEVYERLVELIEAHRTTLIFVNTRRVAERVTQQLSERLGSDKVTSHHGSLSARLRLQAENRLKAGELKALVATASLELGIDIGSVDLVCQIGSTRSIAAFLQRAGRSGHHREGKPKARLFPLTRDELAECAAILRSVRRGELDELVIPVKPLDILAQQIVAAAACEDWKEDDLLELARRAYPYRGLEAGEFEAVTRMLAEGFTTRRGRRGALIHHDGVNRRIRGRRGARLTALTSGGAIPDNADYKVTLEPAGTFLGTVNEDFAIESMAGDIFQLGNASWRIQRVASGTVFVEDAGGQPPSIPFWLGEAPARTPQLSQAVSRLRADIESRLDDPRALQDWLMREIPLSASAASQLVEYFHAARRILGVIPTQETLVLERFFDESGGMQLVLHSPFGGRINRAWGLSLRKRFCRSFNFELQAAATEDAIVLSLGNQHSFPLEDVFRYLSSSSVRDLLIQALLDAPMFQTRWRWNASRALAVPRFQGGKKTPAPLLRMLAEDLVAAVFPDQLACLENIVGDREVPDHPLVRQTIDDCLIEAMDIDGLTGILESIEGGAVRCIARDLPEPSPLAHEALTAKPYAFLDDAPLEERRTQAVYLRRALEPSSAADLGALDPQAIRQVCAEAWPQAAGPDEAHDALLLLGLLSDREAREGSDGSSWEPHLEALAREGRAGRLSIEGPDRVRRAFWAAAERLPVIRAACPRVEFPADLRTPERDRSRAWERVDALAELARGRLEASGPTTAAELADRLALAEADVELGLLALEAEGFVLRGSFRAGASEREWCNRRLLARIHRLTINRLRAEIEPVTAADFLRFLLQWHRVDPAPGAEGPLGVAAIAELLDGFEAQAGAWESDLLPARVAGYDPLWLDGYCLSGHVGWGRMSRPQGAGPGRVFASGPLRSSPVALFLREHAAAWLEQSGGAETQPASSDAQRVLQELEKRGALFFKELLKATGLLHTQLENALGELAAVGRVTSDSFAGLRALLVPAHKREPRAARARRRRRDQPQGIETAGRWSVLERGSPGGGDDEVRREEAVAVQARALLRRYGVVFRRLLERESFHTPWRELARVYRRLEARGEIRGGRFAGSFSGEQFALPEAVGLLRSVRRRAPDGGLICLSAADPLNLAGVITPGERVPAIASNRVLFRDGLPVAALAGGKLLRLAAEEGGGSDDELQAALMRRKAPRRSQQ